MQSKSTVTRLQARFAFARRNLRAILLAAAWLLVAVSPPASAHLLDEFTRADSANVGNSWIEKNPAAFSLAGNQIVKQAVSTGYRDNVVYRPSSEDVLNVEASIEVRFTSLPPGYAQVFTRLQSSTVANADVLDGYMLYVNESASEIILGRQNGNVFVTTLATINLTTPFNTTDRYRLRLRTTGTNPVAVSGFVERLVGTTWTVIGQAAVNDSSAQRIATAGSVGFGGYVEGSYVMDSFTRVDIGAVGTTNPAPTTSGLSPSSAFAGETGLTVVVYGSGFTTDSVVRWNGSNRATTFISTSELEAQITTADLATAGTRQITVFNPTPGGGTSAAQNFQIATPGSPLPTLASLSPSSATAGAAAFTLTVNGTNFNNTSVVRWNGANRTTTYVSPTQLTAAITAADVATAGTASVTVLRQSDSAMTSAQTFTINAPVVPANFTDTFTRADSADVGNGWIEKAPAAFSLAGNEAAKVGAGGADYRNNLVYRPASENLLDAEASIEFRFTSLPVGYPQIFVRAQTGNIGLTNTLDAYLLYVADNSSQAVLARQIGNNWDTVLSNITISPALNTTDRYRMRLRATGTNPVQLNAYIERLVSGSWQIIGQASFNDTAGSRIATAGSVGFGGYIETNYRYDNFVRTDLSAPSPAPTTTSLSPSSATAGAGALNVTVNGTNFAGNSVVRWNGSDRPTTFVSPTQLTAALTAADVATAGSASVTVFTPAPGGGTSNAQTFTINAPSGNPVPTATTLSPASALAGSGAFTLTVNGSNFVSGASVRWNGSARTTTFISSSQVRASINASDVASAGTANVTVFNPTPGGGTSSALTFTITATNPAPVIASLSPSSVTAGSGAFTLTVNGSSFTSSSVVRWNGSNRTTTFISSTELRAAITASDVSSTGSRSVTVFTPTPGGGTSGTLTFNVTSSTPNNPVPVLNQISPMQRAPGSGGFTLTVTGTGFTNQSVVRWNGVARTTTFISSTEIRASIPSSDVANASLAAVTVNTPSPGGGTTNPLTFFVQDSALTYFFDGFNRADSASVGPGWAEKNGNAFSLQGNEIVSTRTNEDFMQGIVYRPSAEDRRDVEISAEIRRLPNTPVLEDANFPQIHARIQRDTVNEPNTLSSYVFFIEDLAVQPRAMFMISRSPFIGARYECYISELPLPQPLIAGERYRMRLRVTGTNPVLLWGAVEQFSNGQWQTLASGSTTHSNQTQVNPNLFCDGMSMPAPLTTAGSVGFSKWWNRTDVYDNFFWRDVSPTELPPAIEATNPAELTAGSGNTTLTVTGARFTANSVVRWNGSNRTTTFISSNELRATITAADLAASGSGTVTVFDSASGQASNAVIVPILPGAPVQTLLDSFTRADSAVLGNGWIEKTAAAFSIANGVARKDPTPGADYRNNFVYRPASEASLNSEVSAELRLTGTPVGYPQILARVLPATVANANTFDGYMLYMNDSSTQAVISRQRSNGGWDTQLTTFGLSEPLAIGQVYRMRLQVIGTAPVQLFGAIERWNGSAWIVIGQGEVNDASGDRITGPGVVGFGGEAESTYNFDNFRRLDYP